MEASIVRLFEHAPVLFAHHQPEQRPFREVLALARRLARPPRLRIDEFVIEEWWPSA
jgi:hypothetical protein